MDHTGWFYEPEAIGMETAWNKIHTRAVGLNDVKLTRMGNMNKNKK